MSDEGKRPLMGGGLGSRARNRTMVMSAESVESVVQPDRDDSSESVESDDAAVADALGFTRAVGSDDYVSPLVEEDETLKTLDEIFGGVTERRHASVLSDVPGFSEVTDGGDIEPSFGGAVAGDDHVDVQGALDSDGGADLYEMQGEPVAKSDPVPSRRILRPSQILSQAYTAALMEEGSAEALSTSTPVGIADHFEDAFESDGEEAALHPRASQVEPPRIVRGVSGSTAAAASFVAEEVSRQVQQREDFEEDPHMQEAAVDQIFWKTDSPLVGFLVSYDHNPKGTYVELRTGRLIVSNQRENSSNCLVINDRSVSPMHAIMRVAPGGVVQVLDQLSESGTRVRRLAQGGEEFLSGEKTTISQGDVVFFGDRKFHVLLVVGEDV